MPSRKFMERSYSIPRSKWKEYLVPIIGGIGSYYRVVAPNKTIAREIANGETHPWIKVKGKVIEVSEEKRRLPV